MKKAISTTLSVLTLCLMTASFANAATAKKAKAKAESGGNETQLQVKACNKKKAGDWVSYGYKGVTFNGVCQANADGKLQFTAPAPNGSSAESAAPVNPVQTTVTQSSPADNGAIPTDTTAPAADAVPTQSAPVDAPAQVDPVETTPALQ